MNRMSNRVVLRDELHIRLPEELDKEPCASVSRQEQASKASGKAQPTAFPGQKDQDRAKQDTLQKSLIKLGRMAATQAHDARTGLGRLAG